MADRPRLLAPGPRPALPLNAGRSSSAPARLVLLPRLIVPASATVKRSFWVLRAPKLPLLRD